MICIFPDVYVDTNDDNIHDHIESGHMVKMVKMALMAVMEWCNISRNMESELSRCKNCHQLAARTWWSCSPTMSPTTKTLYAPYSITFKTICKICLWSSLKSYSAFIQKKLNRCVHYTITKWHTAEQVGPTPKSLKRILVCGLKKCCSTNSVSKEIGWKKVISDLTYPTCLDQ